MHQSLFNQRSFVRGSWLEPFIWETIAEKYKAVYRAAGAADRAILGATLQRPRGGHGIAAIPPSTQEL